MKIGLVLPYNITKHGGVREHVLAQHDELVRRGHELVIITPQPREPYVSDERKVVFLGSATEVKAMHTTPTVSASVLTDEIDGMLEHEQFDLLHFHEPWVPVLSRQILSRSRTVNVATFHAKLPETMMSRTMGRVITPYTKPLLRHIDAFTAVSNAAADYLLSIADVPVEIVPNGIDLKKFRVATAKDRPPTQPKTVLFIGRLEQRKGVKYLLDAFAEVQKHRPEVHLLVAGAGSERETRTFKLQAQELGLQNTTFLGFIDEATKQELLHTADLFCSPALYGESFGIVLVEAMASGLVTVAGDNPGYASVMQGLGALSLINPKDISQFAHRLELLLYDEDLRTIWKKWAKTYVKQFDWPKVVDRYEAVYETALKSPREKNRP